MAGLDRRGCVRRVGLSLGIGVFDEARQLVRGLAYRHDRAGIVHPHRPDHRHGAELALRDTVAGRDQRERAHRRDLVLVADPHIHARLAERRAQHPQQRDPPLEQAHQLVDLRRVLDLAGREQTRASLHVQRVLAFGGRARRTPGPAAARNAELDRRTGSARPGAAGACAHRARARPAARSGTPPPTPPGPGSTGISNVAIIFETPPVEVMITTITTCGCSASTSMWRIVAVFRGGAETTASRLVICDRVSVVAAHRLVHLLTDQRQLEPALTHEPPARAEHPIDHVALTGVGRHTTGGHVGMGEQTMLLEQRQFVAHGRGTAVDLGVGGDRLRRHRLTSAQVAVHDLAQDPLLALGKHGSIVGGRAGALITRGLRTACAAEPHDARSRAQLRRCG